MTDGNGNGNSAGTGAIYAAFDRKLEGIERDLRQDFQNYRTETNNSFSDFRSEIKSDMAGLRSSVAEVLSKLGGRQQTAPANGGGTVKEGLGNTNTFVIVAATIILPLCGLGAYVVGNLDAKFSGIAQGLEEAIKFNAHNIDMANQARVDTTRIIYEKTWPKEAQVEYEKRVDERYAMESHFQDEVNTQIIGETKTIVAQMVPRAEHEQRWSDQKEQFTALEHALSESINRLSNHVNGGDINVAQKFSDVDKSLHGYGIADEMKDIQTQLRDTQDKLFHLTMPSSPLTAAPPTDGH